MGLIGLDRLIVDKQVGWDEMGWDGMGRGEVRLGRTGWWGGQGRFAPALIAAAAAVLGADQDRD